MDVEEEKREDVGNERERNYRLLYLLKRSYKAAKLGLDEVVREDGLTSSDFTLLSFLKRLQPCSAAELARAQRVTPQAVTQQIAQLRVKALIRSETSGINRRISLISMTADGRAALAAVNARSRILEDKMVEGFTTQEGTTLTALLSRLIENFEKRTS